jgi:hypothetical protein
LSINRMATMPRQYSGTRLRDISFDPDSSDGHRACRGLP